MSINCKHNNEVFQTFSATSFLLPFPYISLGDTFLQNPDDVHVIVRNDCNHTFVGFSDKVCLSDAEKLPHWIIEYISRLSCLSRACVLTVNFLKAYCCFGEGVRFSVFGISEESLVVITFEKKTKWLTG